MEHRFPGHSAHAHLVNASRRQLSILSKSLEFANTRTNTRGVFLHRLMTHSSKCITSLINSPFVKHLLNVNRFHIHWDMGKPTPCRTRVWLDGRQRLERRERLRSAVMVGRTPQRRHTVALLITTTVALAVHHTTSALGETEVYIIHVRVLVLSTSMLSTESILKR